MMAPTYLSVPSTDQWRVISEEFLELWNMPHVVGAIDGKHIKIECPPNTGTLYHNYKGFHSMVLLAVCDAKYKFTFIDVGQYGSTNDSAVLNASNLGKALSRNALGFPEEDVLDADYQIDGQCPTCPYYLVGDEIFALKPYLMRPFAGSRAARLDDDVAVFNYRLSRARRTIEQTFGILVARWRIFRTPIKAKPENTVLYVLATTTLHNYLQQTDNSVYCPPGFVDSDVDGTFKEGEWRKIVQDTSILEPLPISRGSRYQDKAVDMRNDLMKYLNSDAGSVPWQLNRVRSTGHIDER